MNRYLIAAAVVVGAWIVWRRVSAAAIDASGGSGNGGDDLSPEERAEQAMRNWGR